MLKWPFVKWPLATPVALALFALALVDLVLVDLVLVDPGVAASTPSRAGPSRAAAPVQSPTSGYDGVWTIDVSSSSFFCPVRSKRLKAEVRGGQVRRLTGLPATASGQIGPDGAVTFILKLFGVTATVRGTATAGAGTGDWSSNSILCPRGDWRAQIQ